MFSTRQFGSALVALLQPPPWWVEAVYFSLPLLVWLVGIVAACWSARFRRWPVLLAWGGAFAASSLPLLIPAVAGFVRQAP